ncbi:MAG TPA: hypothetical protein DC012_03680 [Escherichia sp.]|nr:hypothetical protein [Escherichia sp.]
MFTSGDGKVRIECRFESDTLWLSQAMICELYGKAKATISGHIKNIFEDGELDGNSVVRFYRTTAADGKKYQVQYFSLPLILAVGYRVRSIRGTQFRQWATQTLQEYLIKGFVMDDERLKNPPVGSSVVPDYFDEMLERIRDIRASERRVYLRVREIFALAAEDQARRRKQIFLHDWQDKLDQFLQFNDRDVLQGTGKISKKLADEKAQAEYSQFAEQQRRLKEAEGEKDIAALLQWEKEAKK